MIINYIKKKILGYSLPQEYACVALEEITDPLRVTLTIKEDNTFLDVSNTHLFLGYKPLIIGIPVQQYLPDLHAFASHELTKFVFHFTKASLNQIQSGRDFLSFDGSVARIILKKQAGY